MKTRIPSPAATIMCVPLSSAVRSNPRAFIVFRGNMGFSHEPSPVEGPIAPHVCQKVGNCLHGLAAIEPPAPFAEEWTPVSVTQASYPTLLEAETPTEAFRVEPVDGRGEPLAVGGRFEVGRVGGFQDERAGAFAELR